MNALNKSMQNTRNKIDAVIQARMGSTRLPKKALLKIQGRTLIEWIFYRLSFCKEIDTVVLSTSDTTENNVLVKHAEAIGLPYFRGSETDLILRHLGAGLKHGADAIVRITADCPLVDPAIVDKLVCVFKDSQDQFDLVTNVFPPTYPDGMDVEVIPMRTLERLDREVQDPRYREWLTVAIMENPQKFKIKNVKYKDDFSGLRLTVDYPEDLRLTEEIFKTLHKEGATFYLEDILKLLQEKPELPRINKKWIDKTMINNSRLKAFYNLKSHQ